MKKRYCTGGTRGRAVFVDGTLADSYGGLIAVHQGSDGSYFASSDSLGIAVDRLLAEKHASDLRKHK